MVEGRLRYAVHWEAPRSMLEKTDAIIAGSKPFYGLYHPFRYPNWAAKFWADALLLALGLSSQPDLLPRLRTW